MPNHVKNVITLYGDETNIKRFLNNFSYDTEELKKTNTIDFNKILPMPKELNITFGSDLNRCLSLYLTKLDPSVSYYGEMDKKLDKKAFNELTLLISKQKSNGILEYEPLSSEKIAYILENNDEEKSISFAMVVVDNIKKYGHATWYSWHRENWGTKWNAYDFEKGEDNEIIFHTAWSCPIPVILEASRLNPNICLKLDYADECFGYNCGSLVIKHGSLMQNFCPDEFSKEAFDLSLKIHDCTYSEIDMVPSFDKTTLIPLYEEYNVCYFKDHKCLGCETMTSTNHVPAGYAIYFFNDNYITSQYQDDTKGIIMCDETLDLEQNGIIPIKKGDITFTSEKLTLAEYFSGVPNIYLDSDKLDEELDFSQKFIY